MCLFLFCVIVCDCNSVCGERCLSLFLKHEQYVCDIVCGERCMSNDIFFSRHVVSHNLCNHLMHM